MEKRLYVIKSSKHMLTCKRCKWEYMPMTKRTLDKCPKCEPEDQQVAYIDPDLAYLDDQMVLEENVNLDSLNEGWGNIPYELPCNMVV